MIAPLDGTTTPSEQAPAGYVSAKDPKTGRYLVGPDGMWVYVKAGDPTGKGGYVIPEWKNGRPTGAVVPLDGKDVKVPQQGSTTSPTVPATSLSQLPSTEAQNGRLAPRKGGGIDPATCGGVDIALLEKELGAHEAQGDSWCADHVAFEQQEHLY